MGRPVASCAVKLLQPRPMCSPDAILQELREQAGQAHPHLISLQQSGVIRSGPAQDWIYLVWELADYSLQDLLSRGETLTPTQVRECLVHILDALSYLHDQGVVHGEIRPSNILLTQSGWRLAGLEYRGLLSRRLEEVGFSQNHFVFRSPEAQERSADHPSADLWSLAVVAHAALTGHLPFDEEEARDRSDLLWRIVHEEPIPEPLGEPFDRLMANCLVREPSERWTAEQALQCMQGQPVIDIPRAALATVYPVGYQPEAPPQEETAPPPSQAFPEALPLPATTSPGYVILGLALIMIGLFIGKFLLPPPPRRITQVPETMQVPQQYSVAYLDERGRLQTRLAQAPVFQEDLGEGVTLDFIQIPSGDFEQGASPREAQQEVDERPRQRAHLDAYWMGRTEVTQLQWSLICSWPAVERELPRAPWRTSGENLPAHGISWEQAREFCLRLSSATGRLHRLPTESEWEYACRGGPYDSPFHFGPVLTDQVANFAPLPAFSTRVPPGRTPEGPLAVDTYPYANHFGLFQMHGNVKEWCSDFYGPYTDWMKVNPKGPKKGESRVLRGGSFRSPAFNCRSSARAHEAPALASPDVGFRVVIPDTILTGESF